MGIPHIYKEIGPGDRIALSKLAVEKFEQTGRPLRIAIDTSIWLFQSQAGKGGTNPALRTFYYRLLRLLSHSMHPLFVFDGPKKPPFKRNKRTGPNVASVPEFLAKQLLKQFGFPFHIAPGEAEAECALLQREGIVDAVLSEDVDTLMFGSRILLRTWSSDGKSKTTHVYLYDAEKTKAGPAGLDREGLILVALMSGGDYLPEGIPGCGPKIACEAARAGFGSRLCAIAKRDTVAIQEWRKDLAHELRTNESKFFKRKHGALTIPEDFPRADILNYYANPAISSRDGLERLRRNLRWDQDLNFPELRTFTADAFDWVKVTGAKKFIRNLAPALLARNLRMRGQAAADGSLPDEHDVAEAEEAKLVASIHGKRQHASTDNTTELRVAFSPIDIVNIDLDAEEPDDESDEGEDEDDDEDEDEVLGNGDGETPKKRPFLFDPTKLERAWICETFVKVGAPLTVQDWEEAQRKKAAPKPARVTKPRAAEKATGGMQRGTLNQFAKITKAGAAPRSAKRRSPSIDRLDLSAPSETRKTPSDLPMTSSDQRRKPSVAPKSSTQTTREPIYINILSSSPAAPCKELEPQTETLDEHYLSPNVTKRVRTLRRSQTAPGGCADAVPSQSAAIADGSQTSPIAGDLLTPSALDPIREIEPLPQLSQVQKPIRSRGGPSQARSPSAPSNRRQQRGASNDVTPSKKQITLEESFGFSKGGTPSKTRQSNFLEVTEKDVSAFVPSVEGLEELDLSRSSPPAVRGKTSQELLSSRTQTSPQLPRPSEEVSRRGTRAGARNSGDRVLQATSGNRALRAKATEATRRSQKAPSTTASRQAILELSPGLQRSPRQHRTLPSPMALKAGETAPELRRSPRHRRTSSTQAEIKTSTATNLRSSPGQHSTADRQVIKLRQSLQGSWKLVDASSVDVLDMTGDGPSQSSGGGKKAGGSRGRRKAWRQSEVEVLDLTSG